MRVALELPRLGGEQVDIVAELCALAPEALGERRGQAHELLLALGRIGPLLRQIVAGVLREGVAVIVQPAEEREGEKRDASDGCRAHDPAVCHHTALALAHGDLANPVPDVPQAEQQEQRRHPLGHREADERRQESHGRGRRGVHRLRVPFGCLGIRLRERRRRKGDDP